MENIQTITPQPKPKKTITKKLRDNPWMISTFILGLIILIVLVASILEDMNQNNILLPNNSSVDNNSSTRMLTPQEVCPQIRVVPSWIKGNEIMEGYNNFVNETSVNIVNGLIQGKVYFAWSSTCSVCARQKLLFGNEWQRYVDSGYTIQCG